MLFVLGLLSVSIRQQSQELQNGGNVNDLDKIVSNSVRARCLKDCSHWIYVFVRFLKVSRF